MSNCPCQCNDCFSGVHDESWQVCCDQAREIERLRGVIAKASFLLQDGMTVHTQETDD